MNVKLKLFRLFGHWEDVQIQGTYRTYRLYAYHILDRLLTLALILVVWALLFTFFLRSPKPGYLGIYFRVIGTFYLPPDIKPLLKAFFWWNAAVAVPYTITHTLEHRKQMHILRGELVARQGVLRRIGYYNYGSKVRDIRYRFLLEVPGRGGKVEHEAYEMPKSLFREWEKTQMSHACRVELVLLPPKNPAKRRDSGSLSDSYTNMLHMRVEHIFWLETSSGRCRPEENLLFFPERSSRGKKAAGRNKKGLQYTKEDQSK